MLEGLNLFGLCADLFSSKEMEVNGMARGFLKGVVKQTKSLKSPNIVLIKCLEGSSESSKYRFI